MRRLVDWFVDCACVVLQQWGKLHFSTNGYEMITGFTTFFVLNRYFDNEPVPHARWWSKRSGAFRFSESIGCVRVNAISFAIFYRSYTWLNPALLAAGGG